MCKIKLSEALSKARGYVAVRCDGSFVLDTSMFGELVNKVTKKYAYSLFSDRYVSFFYVNNNGILTFELERHNHDISRMGS